MEKLESKRRRIIDINGALPRHIVHVIFSKLPISNLPACRFVCKAWNDLVLEYASSPKHLPNAFFLCTSDISCSNSKLHCIDIDTKHLEWMSSVASFGFHNHWSNVSVYNSCNGLLFIRINSYVACCLGILNPMTNEFVQISQHVADKDIYGFGFSPTTKQYKLFRVYSDQTREFKFGSTIEVFKFAKSGTYTDYNQWRYLHLLPLAIHGNGAYLNGVIYWIGKEKNKENKYVVYALDVETEQIELNAVLEVGPYSKGAVIQQFNGSIYATFFMYPSFFKNPASSTIQVWRMQEKGSWIREFVIDDIPSDWVSQHRQAVFFHLVKAFEDGEILCEVDLHLFCVYNPKTGTKKMRTFNQNHSRRFCRIESLNFDSLWDILAGETSMTFGDDHNYVEY